MVPGFGGSVFQILAFGLAFAMSCGFRVEAQTVPPCHTTAGQDGLLFEGTYALIHAPVAFDTATTEATQVWIAPEVRDGLGVLAYGKKASAESVVVEFLTNGAVVHQCGARVVAFDLVVHDPAQMQTGDCDLQAIAGRSLLMAGHGQVLEVSGAPVAKADGFGRSSFEASMADPSVADLSILADRRLYLLGKEPGVTVLLWMVQRPDESFAINLCQVAVVSPDAVWGAEGPGDKDLCQDKDGIPLRLSVGQMATMRFPDTGEQGASFGEASIAAPDVADFEFAEGGLSGTVRGLAPGSTSITLLNYDGSLSSNCEVVVK